MYNYDPNQNPFAPRQDMGQQENPYAMRVPPYQEPQQNAAEAAQEIATDPTTGMMVAAMGGGGEQGKSRGEQVSTLQSILKIFGIGGGSGGGSSAGLG